MRDSANNKATVDSVKWVIASMITKPIRTIEEFAEQEVFLPKDGGPFEGQLFAVRRQPFVSLLWEQMQSSRWSEVWVTGCVQSGKTLMAFVIPLIYMIVELQKSPIAAIPDGTMITDKWSVDIEPVFKANKDFESLLPLKGPGSKGGAPKSYVKLTSGFQIKFMTKGGSDQSKAGYTAPYIVVTEAAGWSQGTETSKESSPIDQVRGRAMASSKFDEMGNVASNSMMVVEGTVTDEDDLPLSEWDRTTQSRIACKCPYCSEFVTPEREHLRGWKGAGNELQAAAETHFVCPACDHKISSKDRREMNSVGNCVLLHHGQKMVDGEIVGGVPGTTKFGFRWNAFNNLFKPPADYGAMEWEASQLEDGSPKWENAEKRLCQQVWVIPFTPKRLALSRINSKTVRRRQRELPAGVVPKDTVFLVKGVDVGMWTCHYVTLAFTSTGQIHIPTYGGANTALMQEDKASKEHQNIAIANCVAGIFNVAETGLAIEGGGIKAYDQVLCDVRYRPEAVQLGLSKFPEDVFMAILGFGKTLSNKGRPGVPYRKPDRLNKVTREIGTDAPWHVDYERNYFAYRMKIDADYSKSEFQDCLRIEPGYPGSVTFSKAPAQEHSGISRQFVSELKDADGNWVKKGENHKLDCAGYAYMGALRLGWSVEDYSEFVPLVAPKQTPVERKRSWLYQKINGEI